MKRSAMDIIIAISCTGKWMRFSGRISVSRPSVSELGEVVRVSICEQTTSRISLAAMKNAVRRPSSVIRRKPSRKISFPPD